MDTGDLATWVGSGFAAIAAAATLWTLKSQRDQIGEQRAFIGEQSATLALERESLRAAAEDRRWAQARQVRMRHHKSGSTTDAEGNPVRDDQWVVTVMNASDAPVHAVEVRFGTAYLADEVFELAPTAAHNWGAELGDRLMSPVHLLGPGRIVRFCSQRWPAATVHNNRPVLYFADDASARWMLDSYGKLEEVPPQ
ncbi:hypothetical protein [Streptomyces sp. MBT62]|uniref:hypothetical protein n=1 Tax=Streptomyces sp. MBT62 TaxID=2800410 RepID=UPI00190D4030|nr:hypothetical protein [Streptomyces sp. MBT62]MBK3569979.1 hypothetical protein [Streptomyces sp. MBT62]